MSVHSIEHKIRVSIGKALHHKHHNPDGKLDIEHVSKEHDVSEDQVKEQFGYLHRQNLVGGPLAYEGEQIAGVPSGMLTDASLSSEGLEWALAGYPYS